MCRGTWHSLGMALLWAIALSGCGTLHPSSSSPSASVATKSDAAAVESDVAQSLQRQIKERDKRIAQLRSQIAELRTQIKALKVIDLEMDERMKSRRPSVMLIPAATDPPR
jgi:TolA-binding protein